MNTHTHTQALPYSHPLPSLSDAFAPFSSLLLPHFSSRCAFDPSRLCPGFTRACKTTVAFRTTLPSRSFTFDESGQQHPVDVAAKWQGSDPGRQFTDKLSGGKWSSLAWKIIADVKTVAPPRNHTPTFHLPYSSPHPLLLVFGRRRRSRPS